MGTVKLILGLVTVGLLSGCDVFNKLASAQQPKIVEIDAGYMIQLDGKQVPIAGTSECVSDKSRHNCIVVTSDTKAVEVLVGVTDRPPQERWTVDRAGGRTMLRRADGEYVFTAN